VLHRQHEVISKRVAERLWRLLPRDDAECRLDKIADEIRSNPRVDEDLLDIALESIREHLRELDDGMSGHA
jgi:hypothetical protein